MRIDNGNSRGDQSNSSRFERIAEREARAAERQERKEARQAERQAPAATPNLPNTPVDVIPLEEPTPIDPGFGNGPIPPVIEPFPIETPTPLPFPVDPCRGAGPTSPPESPPLDPSGLPRPGDPIVIDPPIFVDPPVPIDAGFGGGTIFPPLISRGSNEGSE